MKTVSRKNCYDNPKRDSTVSVHVSAYTVCHSQHNGTADGSVAGGSIVSWHSFERWLHGQMLVNVHRKVPDRRRRLENAVADRHEIYLAQLG